MRACSARERRNPAVRPRGRRSASARCSLGAMRIHTSSAGMDVARLEPGADLVLAIEDAQGADLREGVLAHDHLDLEARRQVDSATLGAIATWRELHDEPLTVEGVCLPWMWELPLLIAFNPVIRDAAGLSRAVAKYQPDRLELA